MAKSVEPFKFILNCDLS